MFGYPVKFGNDSTLLGQTSLVAYYIQLCRVMKSISQLRNNLQDTETKNP